MTVIVQRPHYGVDFTAYVDGEPETVFNGNSFDEALGRALHAQGVEPPIRDDVIRVVDDQHGQYRVEYSAYGF